MDFLLEIESIILDITFGIIFLAIKLIFILLIVSTFIVLFLRIVIIIWAVYSVVKALE